MGDRTDRGRRRRGSWRPRAAAGVVALVALTAACGGGDDEASPAAGELPARLVTSIPAPRTGAQAPGTYVGVPDGRVPYVALVAQGNDVLAFVCDGDTVGEPLGGAKAGSDFDLSRNGVRLRGTVQGDVVTGELTVPGTGPAAFTARRAVEGRTGLYRAETTVGADEAVTWWIQTEQGIKGLTTSQKGKRGFETADPAGFEGAVVGEAPAR